MHARALIFNFQFSICFYLLRSCDIDEALYFATDDGAVGIKLALGRAAQELRVRKLGRDQRAYLLVRERRQLLVAKLAFDKFVLEIARVVYADRQISIIWRGNIFFYIYFITSRILSIYESTSSLVSAIAVAA